MHAGFRPRHLGPAAKPDANDSASRSRSSACRWLRSAFASSVSWPCLYCGWSAPRLTVDGLRLPWYLQTLIPNAAGFQHLLALARQIAVQRIALPNFTDGSGTIELSCIC